jgi:DNA-binding NarL/FixJ family response regulator
MTNSEMPTKKHILIIDDHPMSVDGYVTLLSSIKTNKNAEYHLAYNCKEGADLLKEMETNKTVIDIAFIDVNLPPYEEKKILSGVDLAVLLRKTFPSCKIVIISIHSEPVWVSQIFKSINPEGFISKNDINYKLFPDACQRILNNEHYISPTIAESQKYFIQKNFNWDEYDSKILLLISEGKKTINLPNFIPLSLSAIEKRKASIKKQLVYDVGSDLELIEAAKKLGFI